jgi:hypothetical protein
VAAPDRPLEWAEVLTEEFEALRGAVPSESRSDIHRVIHQHAEPTSALCLSGGGVRSGTFALGVLQGLAHLGVLGKFDYLSTVSGGGYIGGWLSAWLQRSGAAGREHVLRALDPAQAAAVSGGIEAPAVDYLRRSCKYLAPTGGPTSADFWTLLATMARNLFLNWLVILPLVAAALLIPRISFAITETLEIVGNGTLSGSACLTDSPKSMIWLGITVASFLTSFSYVALVFGGRGAAWSQQRFLLWCLTPMVIGAIAGANFWAAFPCELDLLMMVTGCAAIPVVGWFALTRRGGWRTFIAAAFAGAVVGAGAYLFDTSSVFGGLNSAAHAVLYAMLAVPFTLGSIVIAIAMFVGLASHDLDDASLEWWSRCAAWIGLAAVAWLVASTLVFYLADALEAGVEILLDGFGADRRWTTAILSALLPVLGSLSGLARQPAGVDGKPTKIASLLQSLIMPMVIVALLTSLAWVNLRVVGNLEYHTYSSDLGSATPCPTQAGALSAVVAVRDGVRRGCHSPGGGLGEILLLLAAYIATGLAMSFFVPVNRFSLHGMYRQRIVRTFLGASRPDRTPNPFTGFDGNDDVRITDLRDVRPLHVVCATLNAVKSTKVGRHEKQSQSFTFSALHAGNREVGYRPAAAYGAQTGKPKTGLTLGTALTVSGAAASSAMGMYSSKARAFLLTLANARLGLWFGNPASDSSWRSSEPPLGVDPIARELLGLTTDNNPFVYLSDGGHYDNLGLWEMVARRCRVIVVSDAGADPDYTFDSLSTAVRRIRLDLGIPIEFGALGITKDGELHGNAHGAVGVIRYSVIDGPQASDGKLVFLRAALSGDEPIDILTYAKTNPSFPNDPTSDQFFDEAHFESYRLLGFHTVLSAFRGFEPGGSPSMLADTARLNYRDHSSAEPPEVPGTSPSGASETSLSSISRAS